MNKWLRSKGYNNRFAEMIRTYLKSRNLKEHKVHKYYTKSTTHWL